MSATITTGISFDIDTIVELDKVANELGISRSRFVQIAIRNQIKLHRRQNVREYLDTLDDNDLNTLKELIKKRS